MSPQSMSAQDVSEALPPHGFGVPDLYPNRVYDDSHDEGYDSVYYWLSLKQKEPIPSVYTLFLKTKDF